MVREHGGDWWQMRCRSVDSNGEPLKASSAPSSTFQREAHVEDISLRAVPTAAREDGMPKEGDHDSQASNSSAGFTSLHAQAAQAQVIPTHRAQDRLADSAAGGRLASEGLHRASVLGATAASADVHIACPGFERQKGASSREWGPPMIVSAIERVQSGLIGETLSSMGITGLYVTLVFGLGRFLRMGLTNIRMRIPYQDLPSVERLTTLCNYIAVAREERELLLEEQLFYSLLNIFRSPAVLFEVTKKDD
jgi:hypothetical protein